MFIVVIELGVSERRSSVREHRVSPPVRDDRRWGLESGRPATALRRCWALRRSQIAGLSGLIEVSGWIVIVILMWVIRVWLFDLFWFCFVQVLGLKF